MRGSLMRICGSAPTTTRAGQHDFPVPERQRIACECDVALRGCRCVPQGRGGAMASYVATRDEKHSTRGRASPVGVAAGEVLESGWQNEDVKDALDLCSRARLARPNARPTSTSRPTRPNFWPTTTKDGRGPVAYAFGLIDRWARIASRTTTRECPRAIPADRGHREGSAEDRPAAQIARVFEQDIQVANRKNRRRRGGTLVPPNRCSSGRTHCKLFPAPHCRGGVSGALGRRIQRQGPPTPCVLRAAAV